MSNPVPSSSTSSPSSALDGRAPGVVSLELRGVSVRYGPILALATSDLRFEGGRSVALVGSNGSGKSTLLGVLAGLVPPTRGTLEIVPPGRPRARISFVAQQHAFHRWMPMTVDEVLRMGRFRRLGLVRPVRRADRDAIAAAAERLGVADLRRRTFGQLSGGQRQRVLVAQALVDDPDLLLLDEPITGLDLPSQEAILDVIDVEAKRGAAVVFSTHHLDEARRADRVILLAGEVVADGPPDRALRPELLAAAFGGRLLRVDDPDGGAAVLIDEHGHGETHDVCDHPDPGRSDPH